MIYKAENCICVEKGQGKELKIKRCQGLVEKRAKKPIQCQGGNSR